MSKLLEYCVYLLSVLTTIFLVACDDVPKSLEQSVVLTGKTMGTTYTVKYLSGSQNLPKPELIQAELEQVLEEVNRQMSTYREDSEISRFNQSQEINQPMVISDDFAEVVNEAIRLNKLTDGALDVTIGPLVNLWGFGPDKRIIKEPTVKQLEETNQYIGIDKFSLTDKASNHPITLTKKSAKVYLDLSAIAKGFGVDKLAMQLEKNGIEHYLVEIGGELRAKGHNLQNLPWKVGIEQPELLHTQNSQIVVPLNNQALATSGDYRHFHIDEQGNRLSHIINPQNKRPINHQLASISVVAPTTMTADGLATGLFVLGEQRAMEIAEQNQLAVFLIIKTPDGYRTEMSSAFKQLLAQ